MTQELIKCLSNSNPNPDAALLEGILTGHPELNLNAMILLEDRRNDTPLNLVCGWLNELELVTCLLRHNADPNIQGAYKKVPLHNAQNLDTIALLRDRGAMVNVRDNEDKLPLHYAFDIDHARALIGGDVVIDTPYRDNKTLFSNVVFNANGDYTFAKNLVTEFGASIDTNIWNNISRYEGYRLSTYDFIGFLIKHNAPLDVSDFKTTNPIFYDFLHGAVHHAFRTVHANYVQPDGSLLPHEDAGTEYQATVDALVQQFGLLGNADQ